MKIDISKLSEDREVNLFEEWDAEKFDLNVPGLSYPGPLTVEVFVKRESAIVAVEVSVRAKALLTCARCFKNFDSPWDKTFKFAYPFDLNEKIIFLDDNIREELILDYPQRVLCRQDCKGLCIKCGKDLNEGQCQCKGN